MSGDSSVGDDFDRLAESFLARLRRGERPSLSEYAERHPDLAEKIRDLFPALVEMEGLKPGADGSTGLYEPRGGRARDAGLPGHLGDYQILRVIGSGGMGVVYEAERESLRAHVALKVLHPRCRDDPIFRARFRNEARSAARLHHTNIVQVFDFGEHDGILYYAMQYIPGQGLDRVLGDVRRLREQGPSTPLGPKDAPPILAEALHSGRFRGGPVTPVGVGMATTRSMNPGPESHPSTAEFDLGAERKPGGPLSESDRNRDSGSPSQISSLAGSDHRRYHDEVARIGAEVADALNYAHDLGVLHRDIKPSNLLLDARGTAWVTDFGLAKFDGSEDLTDSGDVVGTLRYIAPERFEGLSDAGCDIYALGVTLYEMLALRPAFGESNKVLLIRSILEKTPTPLRKIDPRISLDLSTVVHRAMARDPADRFPSAGEMAAELRRVIKNETIQSRRTPAHERYWRWCRRNPLLAGLNALAAALTVAVAVVSTSAAIQYRSANTDSVKQLNRIKATEADRSEKLWEAKLAQARASRYSRRPGQRIDALAGIAEAVTLGRQLNHPPERFARLRNEAIAALALPDIQTAREFGHWPADGVVADVDDDFELYVLSDLQGRCVVRRIADDVEVTRLPQIPRPRNVVFGPGRLLMEGIAPEGVRTFRVWDISGAEPVMRIEEPRAGEPRALNTWDFHPDGRQLVFVHRDNTLVIHDLTTGRRRTLAPARETLTGPEIRLHPTAPHIVLSSYFSPLVQIRHLVTGETLVLDPPWPGGNGACEWSPDGRTLAVSCGDGGMIALYEFVASPLSVRLVRTLEGGQFSSFVRFNATGDRLFARGWANRMDMFDVEHGHKLFTTPIVQSAMTPRIKTDQGRRRLFPGSVAEPIRRLAYSDVAEGRECRLMTPESPRGVIGSAKVSADGRLAIVTSDRWFTLYDFRAEREIGTIRLPGNPGSTFASFEPTGHLLTASLIGSFRWPVRPNPDRPGDLVVGPPERLRLHPGHLVSMSRDGSLVAQAMYNGYGTAQYAGGWILHGDRPDPPRNVAPGVSMGRADVSPDDRWVAFTGDGGGVVYEARTEQPVWRLPRGGFLGFTPDGKWLASVTDEGRLFAVGTWEPGPQLGHGMVDGFSADGTTAILGVDAGYIRLVEVATGREIARFEGPDPSPGRATITPDGMKILVPRNDGVLVWDLRRIRVELAKLGLDWDAPPFPPEVPSAGPVSVTIVGAELLDADSAPSRAQRLLALWLKGSRASIQDSLDRADELAHLGWHDLALRDYDAILRRDSRSTPARMHRGLERFRRGRWADAAADFAAVIEGDPAYEFRGAARSRLAWAYHALGRHGDAAGELTKHLETSPSRQEPADRAGLLLLRAAYHDGAGRPDLAKGDRDLAARLSPKLAEAANERAWRWLTPDPEMRPVENWRFVPAALLLARKAVELAPDDPSIRNTLGVALCRSGRYAEARATLEASLVLGSGKEDAWDLFPLAICHHRLGDRKAARKSYDRAIGWMKGQPPPPTAEARRELADLQTEVRRLLGL